MSLVRVKQKYQVTLPAAVREAANIHEGDTLEARLTDDGNVVLIPQLVTERPKSSQDGPVLTSDLAPDDPVRFKRVQMIQEAKEAADRGELIPHEDVAAWIDSLGTDEELPMPRAHIQN